MHDVIYRIPLTKRFINLPFFLLLFRSITKDGLQSRNIDQPKCNINAEWRKYTMLHPSHGSTENLFISLRMFQSD